MTIAEQIKEHEQRVTSAISKPYATCCPACECTQFHRHEIRKRVFYAKSENGESFAMQSWLVRWRCSNCGTRFTDYPPFALPHKRFVKPSVFRMATDFFREDRSTYRRTTRRAAAHSSLWRWLTWLASLCEQGRRCLRFLMHSDPGNTLHRNVYFVAPWKSRSTGRGSKLQAAFQTLTHIAMFERVVAEKYSPSLEHHSVKE